MDKDNENKKIGVGLGVMILKDDKVLLGHRHQDPKKADSLLHGEGSWTLPGGKLHFQEELKQGARREVLEETGIEVKNLEAISMTNDIVLDNHFITIGFLCREFDGEAKIMEPEEITEWQWFGLNDLPSPLFLPSQKIIKNYLAKKICQDE